MKFTIDPKTGAYSDPHIISVSDPITEFDDKLFELYTKKGLASGNKCDDQAVLTPEVFPIGLECQEGEDSDVADVIISINDDMNALYVSKASVQLFRRL